MLSSWAKPPYKDIYYSKTSVKYNYYYIVKTKAKNYMLIILQMWFVDILLYNWYKETGFSATHPDYRELYDVILLKFKQQKGHSAHTHIFQ